MSTYRIAVTGGRDHRITTEEREYLRDFLAFLREDREFIVLLHGNCRGVDREAARLAEEWGFPAVPFEAPWNYVMRDAGGERLPQKVGTQAGPLRNWMMLQAADLLIAFPGGRGTANCIKQARELGVEVAEVGR